jgi:UPF0755 protein
VKVEWKSVRTLLGLFILFLTSFGVVHIYRIFYGSNNFVGSAEKVFFVNRGQSFASVVDSLQSQGIIRSRELFIFVARVRGGTSRIRVGKYIFRSGISNAELSRSLRDGLGIKLIPVTIPEGRLARIQARIFARTLGVDSAQYMNLVRDESFSRSLGIEAASLEGFLLPETYSFFWQPDERDIIRRQVGEFMLFYDDSLQERAKELNWTPNQVVTFASIIEGEAVLSEERPIISGVYHNRLQKHMKLEADPTIRFILENAPRRVLYSDLRTDSPYNTYRNEGLPPGPINSPGKASILAALYPSQHNYYYFVANGRGGHWFSTSYEDHMRNVRKYRRERARNRTQARAEARDTTTLNARRSSAPAN